MRLHYPPDPEFEIRPASEVEHATSLSRGFPTIPMLYYDLKQPVLNFKGIGS